MTTLTPISLPEGEGSISSLNLTDGCDGVISSNPVTLIRPNTDRGQKASPDKGCTMHNLGDRTQRPKGD